LSVSFFWSTSIILDANLPGYRRAQTSFRSCLVLVRVYRSDRQPESTPLDLPFKLNIFTSVTVNLVTHLFFFFIFFVKGALNGFTINWVDGAAYDFVCPLGESARKSPGYENPACIVLRSICMLSDTSLLLRDSSSVMLC